MGGFIIRFKLLRSLASYQRSGKRHMTNQPYRADLNIERNARLDHFLGLFPLRSNSIHHDENRLADRFHEIKGGSIWPPYREWQDGKGSE